MSGAIDTQIDLATVSMTGLGSFSTVLATLSSDDVQPIAMLQLEQLGAAFPISGQLRAEIPDHLRRCTSTRLDRLGVMVGWRKGDAASLMSHSAGGQAIALLATCLENIYGNNDTASILYKLSKTLLPDAALLSSPKQLAQATDILSRKLGIIGFGTILAKRVCHIHDAYRIVAQKTPMSILAPLGQDAISDILFKFSRALREDNRLVRVRGCASMGYIAALAVSLFADDCIVTIENKVLVHQGCRSSSISLDITSSLGDRSLEVTFMGKIESLLDIPVKPTRPSPALKYAYNGHLAAFMQLYMQEWGLTCSLKTLETIGICILSLSHLIFISTGEKIGRQRNSSFNLFEHMLGEYPRAALHQRCETALGVSLPLKWPSFPECLARLKRVLLKSNQIDSLSQAARHSNIYNDPSDALLRIIDEGVASLAVYPHPGAVWQEHSDPETWRPSEQIQNQGHAQIILTPHELLYKLFSWDEANLIVNSDGTTTLIPTGIIHLGSSPCDDRGLELFDGLLYHDNRYYSQVFADVDYNLWAQQSDYNRECDASSRKKEVTPTSEGVHSDLSLAISEQVRGLVLECSVSAEGRRHSVNLRECVDQLFGLLDAFPCRHSRKTPLKTEYVRKVQINSVLTPDGRSGDHISIVQTAGNPTAQFLSLTKWESAILCRRCCLNCAYEQAREKEIHKIIVA